MSLDKRAEVLKLTGHLEKFLEWGSSTATVAAPEKAPTWTKALILVRCFRFELGRPEHARKAPTATRKAP